MGQGRPHDLKFFDSPLKSFQTGNYRWWPAEVVQPDDIPEHIYKMKSCPGEFVIRYFGSNDYNWMSKSRCFPYRGRQDDPHFVANFYSQFINKTKLSKNETLFKEGLIQAEKVFEERLQVNKPGLIRKHKELKRNKPSKKAAFYNKNKDAIEEIEKCLCKEDNPCGPDSNCVNRSLFVECGVR